MIPVDLKRAITEAKTSGQIPIFVNATCGTTVLGAFDPISDIASICKEENMWLHIDVRKIFILINTLHNKFPV